MDQITQDREREEEDKRMAKLTKKEQMEELRRRAEEAEGDFEERTHTLNEDARYFGTYWR